MFAAIDIGLISFAFAAIIAACWAFSMNSANKRIGKLEQEVAKLQANAPR